MSQQLVELLPTTTQVVFCLTSSVWDRVVEEFWTNTYITSVHLGLYLVLLSSLKVTPQGFSQAKVLDQCLVQDCKT